MTARSVFEDVPWAQIKSLATRALLAWREPHAGLPKLQEECAEVIMAVAHYRTGRIMKSVLAKELVDNILMLVQASLIVGEEELMQAIDVKLRRLRERLTQHQLNCPCCHGDGVLADGDLCHVCYPTREHVEGCAVADGMPCACVRIAGADFIVRAKRPADLVNPERIGVHASDDWLEEVFRDFAEGTYVRDWRRRLYERCVGHYLSQRGALP